MSGQALPMAPVRLCPTEWIQEDPASSTHRLSLLVHTSVNLSVLRIFHGGRSRGSLVKLKTGLPALTLFNLIRKLSSDHFLSTWLS